MFHSARLKLTAWYLLIVFAIILFFSVAMYSLLTQEVERFARMQRFRFEHRYNIITPNGDQIEFRSPDPNQPAIDPDLVEETKHRIIIMLVAIDGLLLLIAGGLGYFLAGKTLGPIRTMMEDQNRFIGDASHELRTPLTALKSAMEVHVRDKHLTLAQARSLIGDSIGEVNKLQALSDSLLQSIQYQRPNGHVPMKVFALSGVIEKAVHTFRSVAQTKDVRLTTEGEDVIIEGYEYSIHDLLRILLDNAIKYSPSGSTVTVTTKKTETNAIITVQDEGIGIDPADMPHIFDRFYRADTARSKNTIAGYGLGLSIAKKIVSLHRGSISVVSEVQKGTTFTVRLPRAHGRRMPTLRLFR